MKLLFFWQRWLRYRRLLRRINEPLVTFMGFGYWHKAWEVVNRTRRVKAIWHGRTHIYVPYMSMIKYKEPVLYEALTAAYPNGRS